MTPERQAASAFAFRRLARSDYALLGRWLTEPHVARWWNHDPSADAIERDFGASIDGDDPADVFIVEHAATPLGLLQRYLFAADPSYLAELAPLLAIPGAALSIDYFVGEPAALRRGLGSAMIGAAVAAIWRDHPTAPSVVVPVCATNVASSRALERAGFRRVATGLLEPDNPIDAWDHAVYRIDRPPPTTHPGDRNARGTRRCSTADTPEPIVDTPIAGNRDRGSKTEPTDASR